MTFTFHLVESNQDNIYLFVFELTTCMPVCAFVSMALLSWIMQFVAHASFMKDVPNVISARIRGTFPIHWQIKLQSINSSTLGHPRVPTCIWSRKLLCTVVTIRYLELPYLCV